MFLRHIFLIALVLDVNLPTLYASSDSENSVAKLQTEADRGVIRAELELAARYITGNGLSKDSALAAHWYERAAQQGDPEAANEIGYFYQMGIGVPTDLSRAIRWYQFSSSEGSAYGKLNLASLYATGIGVNKNAPFAIQLLEEAVARRNGAAAAYLGDIYAFGMFGPPDLVEAEKWYETGVKLHDLFSEFNLGTFLSVQPNHVRDYSRAADLLRASASQGYVPAMHSLGLLLIRHPEVKQSPDEAHAMIETAATSGSWRSSVLLGIFARDGTGAPVDKRSALLHFEIAELQGGEEAEKLLSKDIEILTAFFPPEDCSTIHQSARDWYAEHQATQSEFVTTDPALAKFFPYRPTAVASPAVHSFTAHQ
jgi:uncharacterized protein